MPIQPFIPELPDSDALQYVNDTDSTAISEEVTLSLGNHAVMFLCDFGVSKNNCGGDFWLEHNGVEIPKSRKTVIMSDKYLSNMDSSQSVCIAARVTAQQGDTVQAKFSYYGNSGTGRVRNPQLITYLCGA